LAVLGLELPAASRSALAGVWAYRTGAERQAVQRFERLSRELRSAGALRELIALADRAGADERRHVALCSRIALAYGGAPEPEGADAAPPIGPASLPFRDRLLFELVAFCCITETLNTSLMTVSLERARVPEVRAALRAILSDEVRHARLGWAHLAAERARGNGQFLGERLPSMLAGAVQAELFSPRPTGSDASALERHGELSEATRLAIFEQTAEHVLVPGFARLGVEVGPMRAWIAHMRN
jgi:hypothetical protein